MGIRNFFKTKEGGLTAAFLAVLAALAVILAGLENGNDTVCVLGFDIIMGAMLYSPIQLLYRLNKKIQERGTDHDN